MLIKYYHITKTLIDNFKCFEMYYIPRESNTGADLLSKMADTKMVGHLKTIIQEMLQTPTIDVDEIMAREKEEPNWMTPYKNFLIWGNYHQTKTKFNASNERSLLCHPWWQAIQKRVDNTLAKMPKQPIGKLHHERNL